MLPTTQNDGHKVHIQIKEVIKLGRILIIITIKCQNAAHNICNYTPFSKKIGASTNC